MKPDAALAVSPPTRALRPNGFLPMSLACRNTSRVFRTPPHARSRFHHAPDARHHPPQWHLSTRYQPHPSPTPSPTRQSAPAFPPNTLVHQFHNWPRPPPPLCSSSLISEVRPDPATQVVGGAGSGLTSAV